MQVIVKPQKKTITITAPTAVVVKARGGPQGPAGAAGATGATGATGPGVASGGTTGQVLAKNSNADYDTEWVDQSAGVTDHGALSGLGDDDHPQYTLHAEAQAIADAKVSDAAYDASSWNGVSDIAPSKNAVRDKLETMSAEIAQKADLVSYSQYGGF